MRIIQYPTTLIGGYSLFNHSDVTNPESDYGHPGYPGIRMSVIGHSTCLLYTSDAADESALG